MVCRSSLLFTILAVVMSSAEPAIAWNASVVSWKVYNSSDWGIGTSSITRVVFDRNGSVWCAAFFSGVLRLKDGVWTSFCRKNSPLPSDTVSDIAIDSSNAVWFSTDAGLARYDGTSWQVYDSTNSILPIRWVSCVAVDRDNSIWAGCGNSVAGGLVKYDGAKWQLFTPTNSILPTSVICDIAVDTNNVVWVGLGQYQGKGGLVRIEGTKWTVYDNKNSPLVYNMVDRLCIDSQNNLWIGMSGILYQTDTLDGALMNFDGHNWQYCNPSSSGWAGNSIDALTFDREGHLWVSTGPETDRSRGKVYDYAVSEYNGTQWFTLTPLNSNWPRMWVPDIAVDSSNNVWLATEAGLFILAQPFVVIKEKPRAANPVLAIPQSARGMDFFTVAGRKMPGAMTRGTLARGSLPHGVYLMRQAMASARKGNAFALER